MFTFTRPQGLCRRCAKSFSTSTRNQRESLTPTVQTTPAYPYGPAQWFKQQDKGLYGGQTVRFGNNVSNDTETKTRRRWYPNINNTFIFSKALNERVKIRVTTRVLRTIDKVGGLDAYLMGESTARIKELGVSGWDLRCRLLAKEHIQKRMDRSREEMGLPTLPRKKIEAEVSQINQELKELRMGKKA